MPCVNANDELLGSDGRYPFRESLGVFGRRGADHHAVGPFLEKHACVVDGADPAAHLDRDLDRRQ